jgi:cell wall-associated NlpC family hydrolase
VAAGLWPLALFAQGEGHQIELHAGQWLGRNNATVYQLRTSGHLAGLFSHGMTLSATVSDSLGRRRAFYGAGYDLLLFRPPRGLGAYGIVGVALGLSTDTGPQRMAAQWTVGAGLEWRPFRFFSVGVESRYRVEDRGPKGFWAVTDRRKGLSWAAGASVRWRRGRSGSQPAVATTPAATPGVPMATAARPIAPGPVTAPDTIVGAASGVVRVALDAIGTPYRWGGTAANGFDCSGLVQWAYNQHGVQLPRMSRAQATAGSEVPPVVEALAPGDILLFAAQPGAGVTHVGMYVGEGKFIHSGNAGVRLSLLDYRDANGAYWMKRWVGARRVMP